MVATKIISLYASLWGRVLSDDITGHDITEFGEKLPKLRRAFSCCVCNEFLANRDVISPTGCLEHFACKACRGKPRDADRKCGKCEDWNSFEENKTLTKMIRSYQSFCHIVLRREDIVRLLETKHEADPNFDVFKLIDILGEGIKGTKPLGKKAEDAKGKDKRFVVLPVSAAKRSRKSDDSSSRPSILAASLSPQKTMVVRSEQSPAKLTQIFISGQPSQDQGKLVATTPTLSTVPSTTRQFIVSTTQSPKTVLASTSAKVVTSSGGGMMILPELPGSAETSPTKGSDEEFILGLSPATSPVKTMPSPSQAVTTTTVSSSAGSTIALKLSPTPHMSGQRVGAPQIVQITHPGGLKTLQVGGQQIRLGPNLALPGRVQIIGSGNRPTTPSSSGSIVIGGGSSPIVINTSTHQGSPGSIILSNSATNPSDSSGPARQRIFLTSQDIPFNQLSDSNRPAFSITEVNGIPMLTALKPNLLTPNALQQLRSQFPLTTQAVTQVRPVSSTASLVRPTATSTATAAGLVRSPVTGTTAIITRTTGPSGAANVHIVRTPLSTSSSTTSPIILRTEGMTQTSQSTPTSSKVPAATTPSTPNPSASSPLTSKRKQEGCRCGNATPTPGKLTCIGQRCACYAERTACLDCKCKGCKNPYVPGGQGQKLLQNTRALIDPNQMSVLTSPITSAGQAPTFQTPPQPNPQPTLMAAIGSNFGSIQTGGPQNSPVQLIPIRYSQPGNYSPQIIQFASAQGLQSLPIFISSAGGHIQASPGGGITFQGIQGLMPGLSSTPGGIRQVHVQATPQQIHQLRPPTTTSATVKLEKPPE